MSGQALKEEERTQPPQGYRYERHRPEQTLLYQLIEQHYPRFLAHLSSEGRTLPGYVQREFEDYLRCGRLEYGFLRVRCLDCHAEKLVAFSCKRRGFCPSCGARRMVESAALLVDEVFPHVPMRQWVLSVPYPLRFLFATHPAAMGESLSIVYRAIESFLIRKAHLTRSKAQCGAVTLIQRFGSALNLNVHFHMLIPDGVYLKHPPLSMRAPASSPQLQLPHTPAAGPDGESEEGEYAARRAEEGQGGYAARREAYLRKVSAPRVAELHALLQRISVRIARHLERQGLLVRDADDSFLDSGFLDRLASDSEGEGVLQELQSHSITYRIAVGPHKGRKAFMLQSLPPLTEEAERPGVAQLAGFSLHAGVAAGAHQRYKLERLARYITRPVLALERLSLTPQGYIRYALKTPYRDGTTHVILEPLDFLARLASLVPLPRVNLTRFHGVFAPHAGLRMRIVPAKPRQQPGPDEEGAFAHRHRAMTWAQRLRRVFNIDIETCELCGGAVKILACIQDPAVIRKMLQGPAGQQFLSSPPPPARGPPGPADGTS